VNKVFNINFSSWDLEDSIQYLNYRIESKLTTHVVTANPEMVMLSKKEPRLLQIINQAELVTPDGIGIVLASKLVGGLIKNRVTGFDLVYKLFENRESKGMKTRVFLLGGKERIVKLAANELSASFNSVEIVGFHDGYFNSDSVVEKEVSQQISSLQPDLLLVGMGCPKQEDFIYRFKHILSASVMIGVGGTFDILSGNTKRAPLWIQKIGIEWLYRLIKEPNRLNRQKSLPLFVYEVLKYKFLNR
jgi:N-acetylglucosaminyldiphosphoundecaprenol N-acetyl-beta-D-mannosaminyltransferase